MEDVADDEDKSVGEALLQVLTWIKKWILLLALVFLFSYFFVIICSYYYYYYS